MFGGIGGFVGSGGLDGGFVACGFCGALFSLHDLLYRLLTSCRASNNLIGDICPDDASCGTHGIDWVPSEVQRVPDAHTSLLTLLVLAQDDLVLVSHCS